MPRFLNFLARGTGSSNPSPSSGESGANSTPWFGDQRPVRLPSSPAARYNRSCSIRLNLVICGCPRCARTVDMDVAQRLRTLGLEQYEPAFRDNDINGEVCAG
jgi:hypothetical protein